MPYKILSALQMMTMFCNITYSVNIFYLYMSPWAPTTKKEGTIHKSENTSLWLMGDGERNASTVALRWLEPNQD